MIADRLRLIQAVSGGGGGGGSFDPSQLSGLQLWLKADAGVTLDESGNVQTWSDQSGNSFNATQTNSAYRPQFLPSSFNSKPSLFFDGTTKRLDGVPLGDGVQTYPEREVLIFCKFDSSLTTENWIYSEGTVGQGDLQIGRIGTNALLRGMSASQYYKGTFNGNSYYPLSVSTTSAGFALRDGYGFFGNQATSAYYTGVSLRSYRIGYPNGYGGLPFKGEISEILVFDRVLTNTEREEVYGYFDDKFRFRTSLLLNMDGTPGSTTFVDSSPNALAVTAVDNAQIVSDATFGTVASFDGNGDYLSVPNAGAFNFGTGDFTVEMWINLPNNNVDYSLIGGPTNGNLNIRRTSDGKISVGRSYIAWDAISSVINTENVWSHIAVTKSSGTMQIFFNGSQVYTGINTQSYTVSSLLIGLTGSSFGYLNGLIGPTRITKGIARYTTSFTPPTGPFPAS